MNEKITGKTSITQKNMDIVLSNLEWDWAEFDPIVYENEPYNEDTPAHEFLADYLTGIDYLIDNYHKTEDPRYLKLIKLLLPAGIKLQSN